MQSNDKKSVASGAAQLAPRIIKHVEACKLAAGDALEHAMAAGDALIEAKRQIPHGEWGEWLEACCSLTIRTAQQYSRLARNRAAIEQMRTAGAHLAIGEARKLIAGPPRPKRDEVQLDDLPAVTADVQYAFGRCGDEPAVCQLEQSQAHPGYFYLETWLIDSCTTTLTKRAMRLDVSGLEMAAALGIAANDAEKRPGDLNDLTPFERLSPWVACGRDKAPIPLIDEDVRRRAYMLYDLKREATTFAEALELAEAEVAA